MATNTVKIPPNAVEMLFVEDLVRWLLRRQTRVNFETRTAEPYRDIILSVFNEDVRKAVNFIDMSLESEIDEHFADLEDLNEKAFLEYAIHYEEFHFKNGFLPDCFLEYCVRLVSMAIHFARRNVPEAINISMYTILKLLENRGTFTEGWDSVIKVARKYAKIYEDCYNVVTPETSDDEPLIQNMEKEPPERNSENESSADSSEHEHLENSSVYGSHVNKENSVCDSVPYKLRKTKAKEATKPERP